MDEKPRTICDSCFQSVPLIPGAVVYCPHVQSGAIFLELGGLRTWLIYSPISAENFRFAAEAVLRGLPATKAAVEGGVIKPSVPVRRTTDD